MGLPQNAFRAATGFLRRNPLEVGRAMRNAMGLRFGLPVEALRWLAQQAEASGKVTDVKIDPVPPGIRFAANVDLMHTPIRASAVIYIDRVALSEEEMTIAIRLEEVNLKLNGDAQTPVAALIKSGALDLTKPGNLAAHLPNLPPVLAEAKDNRLVIDLMRDRRFRSNAVIRRTVGLLSSLVTIHGVESDQGHIDLALRALPRGLSGAAHAVRRHLVMPSMGRLLGSGG